MEFSVLTPSEAFYWAATFAVSHGKRVAPRGIATSEVQNVTFHIKYPQHLDGLPAVPGRDLRPFIGAVEALQLIGQITAPETMVAGSKALGKYRNDGIFLGSYGQRAHGQLARVERLLRDDPATRQAVVTIYNGREDLGHPDSLDVPCTLAVQFLWQPGEPARLGMRVTMRSNDVWLGLPYDLFQFAALQSAYADALGVLPGAYVHSVGSLHAYEKDWDAISTLQSPGEPPRHETRYTPRWGIDHEGLHGIAAVSSRARSLLLGFPPNDMTAPEATLYDALLDGIGSDV